jgi:hypothetical protein
MSPHIIKYQSNMHLNNKNRSLIEIFKYMIDFMIGILIIKDKND